MQLLAAIFFRVNVIPHNKYLAFKAHALEISPDPDDWAFFALALKENCPILSNDKKLKEQSEIIVYSTHELPNPQQESR